MTIKDAQELVDAWVAKHPMQHRGELTTMATLTEEVGELARVIAQRHTDPTIDAAVLRSDMANELSDILWVVLTLASQADIDLTNALIDNLEKKNRQK